MVKEIEHIRQLVLQIIAETGKEDLFLVDVLFTKGRKSAVHVLVDTDTGIQLESCVSISRKLSKVLEEDPEFQFPYTLEVSSPGLDRPLILDRQYQKNIGRNVGIVLKDGTKFNGKLLQTQNGTIILQIPGTKKEPAIEMTFLLENIKETKVTITLN